MSIIDKFFNGGSARKNVPFGYDKRIVMPKSAQDTIPFYEVYDNGLFLTGVISFSRSCRKNRENRFFKKSKVLHFYCYKMRMFFLYHRFSGLSQ